MKSKQTLELIQLNVAQRSIGPSTVRGRGRTGVAEIAREFLGDLDLRRFRATSTSSFTRELDRQTLKLLGALPRRARHWGLARKSLNIFLRDCVDHRVLCHHFGLVQIELWLEVPLDRMIAVGIKSEPEAAHLPRWRTIKGLTPASSSEFQMAAATIATRRGMPRVLLDALYWRAGKRESRYGSLRTPP